MSSNPIAVRGQRITIEWAIDSRGRMPALEFYRDLSRGERQRILALFKRLADTGDIASREHFKSLGKSGDNLWEFKRSQFRFLGDYRPGGRFVVALGLQKKKDDLNRSDIEKASRILAEHDEQDGKGMK
jgi:mRNA-degrading endonuclease RelE of RelBE toxin-antitoxin system